MSARVLLAGAALALLVAFAAIGCSRERSDSATQSAGADVEKEKDKPAALPPGDRDGNEEQDKKALVEFQRRAKSLRNDLRRRQIDLNMKDPSMYPFKRGSNSWGAHSTFTSDSEYQATFSKLARVIGDYNEILERRPTWGVPPLDFNLD